MPAKQSRHPALGVLLVAFALLAGVLTSAGAQPAALEEAVKATFVFRFALFVEWPPEAYANRNDPFVICVAGDDAFADLVNNASRDQRVDGRAIEVKRLRMVNANTDCQILYAGGSSAQSARDMLAAVRQRDVLTVTDEGNGAARGMIHFVLAEHRVRFVIDRTLAEQSRLKISSRLLNVALSAHNQSDGR